MAKQDLNIGASPNDGTGDPLRDAMDKVNDNFGELYTALGGNTPANIVTGGVIDYTGSNKLTFLYTDLSDLPAASSYHGMFAHVHNTGAAYYAHAGAWIQLADKSLVDALTINSLTDVDTATAAPTDGQVLAWSASGSKWVPATDAGGISLSDLSVTVGSAGTANLAYNSATGAFTYTPPDLSGYQLSSGLATVATTGQYTDLLSTPTIPSELTDLGISDGTNGQVLTTDGSGAFSFTTVSGGSGYANSDVDTHLNTGTATAGQILSWTGTDYDWVADQTGGGGGGGLNNVVEDTSPQLGADLDGQTYNITTTGKILYSNNYANLGDLPSASTYHGMFAHVHGEGKAYYAHAGAWVALADNSQLANSANWDTAYGWGDHGSAGYLAANALVGAIDAHLNQNNPTSGHVLSWNGSDYAWVANSGGGGGIALTDLSVGSEGSASGDGAIAYNNTTGVFTYTPPDLSGYLTSYTETQSLDDVVALGDTTARAVTINNTLTVNDIASTGVGFATMTSASDIVLNPAGEVNVSTSKIVNVVDPTNDQEAATKKYVDDAIANSEPAFNITAPNSGIYRFAAGSAGFPAQADNPTIYLYRGLVYHFNINAAGHPFYINTVNGTGTGNAYNAGVTNNGTQSGVIRFEVPMDAPQTLYYNCQYHGAMNGTIVITP